jgi:hypothetical protein
MRPAGRFASAWLAVALTACTGPACTGPESSRTSLPALDHDSRREVYDRTDLDFEAGVLYKPARGTAEGTAWTLAPLLIQEIRPGPGGDTPDPSGPTIVYYRRSSLEIGDRDYTQWTYLWPCPGAQGAQGIRMTLGEDGFPVIYEVMHDTSGARLIFVAVALEEEARNAFGAPLPGRRFTVEPSVEQAPDVVVGGLLESGPTPLGPFVYLWERGNNVNTVICRCMPSRVISIPGTATYDLAPLDPSTAPKSIRHLWTARPLDLESGLRLGSRL